ncbi:Carbohydrate acetyl esterase/feruloyl esterase precursor [Maioricimonas rarisocia]|uniref:Carbohydrate acetyl esterase/feruloyl esterase n=1 Tax=Maioricimonas rarisocia TaxID=2528026 RepID=A0A517Z1Q9_9PLAN|nr:sialate O-acetylesterase [Maioricimonas rarisocia]QDU36430.1 Carbohydrate acetyl esterase/feruloyl esterase precursor [Maioricimonas rarisocia]
MHTFRKLFALIGLSAILGGLPASSLQADDPEPAGKDRFHLYLLIGQSNMAGRGKVDPENNEAHPRVLKFDRDGNWVPATDPIHFDKPTIAGVGLASAFGPAMAEADETVTIGLIPCAVGGTRLERWVKGGDLYENAVRRAKAAMKDGTLKGILWHQGEGDSGKLENASTYAERLSGMIGDLRSELDAENAPFVMGELGRFLNPKKLKHYELVNKQLHTIASQVPHTAVVSSEGLEAKADQVHFNAEALREFGRRYAKAMKTLQKQPRGLE